MDQENRDWLHTAGSPATAIEPDETAKPLADGTALCLSGGGYRAMVFHLGALIRLNEARMLPGIKRVSSVSGGSITAAVLGLAWKSLTFKDQVATNLTDLVIEPVVRMATRTVDWKAILGGLLLPGSTNAKLARLYDKHLFHGATLQDLPADDEGPRFIINSTSLQTGVIWRFSRPYMADYRVGMVPNPNVPISIAVAASSAFPPILSPAILRLNPSGFAGQNRPELQRTPYNTTAILADGGVYDNLGIETAWKRYATVLVSDAGGQMASAPRPPSFWPNQTIRVLNVIDNQVRSLRKRQVIEAFKDELEPHRGTYWGIRSHIADYHLDDPLPCPPESTLPLANLATRLKALPRPVQERLLNWGYAICDAAIRKHIDGTLARPDAFPFHRGLE